MVYSVPERLNTFFRSKPLEFQVTRFNGFRRWIGSALTLASGGLALLVSGTAFAVEETLVVEVPHARAHLLAAGPIGIDDGSGTIAVHFEIDPDWHLYWRGRNDTGFAPQITWDLPSGVTVTERFWPVPERHVSVGGILDHVYESELTLLFDLELESIDEGQIVPIGAKVDWLVCRDVCLFESDSLSLEVEVDKREGDEFESVLRQASRELPLAYGPQANPEVSIHWLKDRVRIEAARADSLQFYPVENCLPTPDLLEIGSARGRRLELPLERAGEVADSLSGVLVIFGSAGAEGKDGRIAYRIEEPRPIR